MRSACPGNIYQLTDMSLFDSVAMAPRDPILGLNEQFVACDNPRKVNLAVGVYFDGAGKLPFLKCVEEAERRLMHTPTPRGYLPIDGSAAYDAEVKSLVFGAQSEAVGSGRIATVQCLGGTGALKVGADFIRQLHPSAAVLISDPSWENHRALFSRAGFVVDSYPYYDEAKLGVNFAGMLSTIQSAPAGTVILLHACCHNPTGYDLTAEQWEEVIAAIKDSGHIAFLDMAYQGFGYGLREDGAVIQRFVDAGLTFFVSTSFSKNLSLYGERVGALSAVCTDRSEAGRVLSQLKIAVRTNYSSPPIHGGGIVAEVLGDRTLRALWELELGEMRGRIKLMRQRLLDGLKSARVEREMDFIVNQIGMFSYSGLTKDQMVQLRNDHGIYGTDTGRICVAALNEGNVDYVCESIAKVL
jgi:aromatic-amino-acid transaminase